MAQPDMPQLTM